MSEKSYDHKDLFGNLIKRNVKGDYHNANGPAIVTLCGTHYWYYAGLLHRTDGPAISYSHGEKRWFIMGRRFDNKTDFFESLTEEEKAVAIFSEDFINS